MMCRTRAMKVTLREAAMIAISAGREKEANHG